MPPSFADFCDAVPEQFPKLVSLMLFILLAGDIGAVVSFPSSLLSTPEEVEETSKEGF